MIYLVSSFDISCHSEVGVIVVLRLWLRSPESEKSLGIYPVMEAAPQEAGLLFNLNC